MSSSFCRKEKYFALDEIGFTGPLPCNIIIVFCFLFSAQQPPAGHGLLIHEVFISHTTTHHSQ